MAVAHASTAESHTGATGSASQASFSFPLGTGTPRGVVVFVSTYASTASLVTSVTYGGVALTRLTGGVAIDSAGETGRIDTFFLGSGLPTGNQTVVVNRTNNATVMYAAAATVNAAADTAVPEQTIVLLQGDRALTVQSVDDTSPGQNSVRYAAAYSGLNAPPGAGTGSTLINSIDIGNYGSAFVRESTAGQGARNVGFSAASDDVAAVHLAIRELVPRSLPQTVGTFTLTGNNATLTKASPKVMDGGTGAFTLTGQPADLRHNPDIEAGVGAFTLAGQPADTRHNPRIEGGTGAFSFTGNDATLTKATPKVLTAETGAFTLSGNPASTLVAVQLGGDVGKFFLPERNLARYSEEFDNAYWLKGKTGTALAPVVTANNSTAPDGTLTADRIVFDTNGSTTTNDRSDFESTTTPSVIGKTYIFSVWLKTTDGSSITIQLSHSAASPTYPTVTGTWQRFTSLSNVAADTIRRPRLSLRVGTPTSAYASLHVWGFQWEEGTSITDYDPTGPAGATDAALRQQYKLTAEVGAFVFTGPPATLAKGRTFTAETGTFTATGQPATLRHSPRIEASTGSFALSGGAPVLVRGRYLSGGSGTFTETGQPVTFRRTWAIQGGTGSFALTGNPAGLTELGAYEIDPIVGAFALTGQAANLTHGQKLQITVGIFSLTGQPATLKQNQQITAGVGAFNLTGQPATLKQNYLINATVGSFSLLGNPATLTKQSALQINAQIGVFNFVGNQAGLAQSRSVDVQVGIFNTTGNSVNLQFNRKTHPVVGIFTVTGNDATLTFGVVNKTLEPATGSFVFAGNPATLQINTPFSAQNGAFLLSGKPVNFSYEQRRRVVFIF